MRLDNELRDRDRVISQLESENQTLTKLLKATEDDLLRVHQQTTNPQQEVIPVDSSNSSNILIRISVCSRGL